MMRDKKDQSNIFVVGIGASAGGLDAIGLFLHNLQYQDDRFAIVIVQHISPDHESRLTALLQQNTLWKVVQIKDNLRIQSGNIYVTPPNKHLEIENNRLILKKFEQDKPVPSIDRFFKSLARAKGARAIGIILSGTGSDGAEGMQAIKKAGGYTLVHDPGHAQHSGMPQAALDGRSCDKVLLVQDMPHEIEQYLSNVEIIRKNNFDNKEDEIGEIFDLLESRTGTDFGRYKPNTILRRINKRLEKLHLSEVRQYITYIKNNPKELDTLFETVLIGVTEFFRDKPAFDELKKYLQKLIKQKKNQKDIRVWSVGTATGEEAYSIAILLAEILQDDISQYNIQIFATDIDEKALKLARKGHYAYNVVEKLPERIIDRYFIRAESHFEVNKLIRQMVLFSKHDVVTDPPFVKLDLVVCRNVLIYFSHKLQKEVLPAFHYALNPDGYLFLGKSESIAAREELFEKLESKSKIFQRSQGNFSHTYKMNSARKIRESNHLTTGFTREEREKTLSELAQEAYFNHFPHSYVIINNDKEILEIKGSIRLYTELKEGEASINIIKMINPELSLELRALLIKVEKTGKMAKSGLISFNVFDKKHLVRISVFPIDYRKNRKACYMIMFDNIDLDAYYAAYPYPTSPNEEDNPRVNALEEELKAAREHLQLFTEELETSNEELQSLNEELQSTNEELKSSNEELETSNEELQSTNEELQTANQELRTTNDELLKKEQELKESNQRVIESEILYKSLARNFPNGTINMVDKNLNLTFVEGLELKTLGFDKKELINKNVLSLHTPEEAQKLHEALNATFKGKQVHEIIRFRNQSYSLSTFPIIKPEKNEIEEVIFVTQNISKQIELSDTLKKALQENRALLAKEEKAHHAVLAQQKMLENLFNAAPSAICIIKGNDWVYDFINPTCKRLLGGKDLLGKPMLEALPELKGTEVEQRMRRVMETGEAFQGTEMEVHYDKFGNGKLHKAFFTFVYHPMFDDSGEVNGILFYGHDVTQEVFIRKKVEETTQFFRSIIDSLPLIAWTADSEGKVEYFNKNWVKYTGKVVEKNFSGVLLDVIHPDDHEKINQLQPDPQKHQALQTEVRFLKMPEKEYRWHIIKTIPILNQQGETDFWIGTAMDINEQKELAIKKDEFLSIASHELKTPLTAINGYYQLIQRHFPDKIEQTKVYLKKIDNSIRRINKLINELLDVSRIDTQKLRLKLERHNVNRLVSEAVDYFGNDNSRIKVIGSSKREIQIDYNRILQVIENLISNALKFSPPKEDIKIHIQDLDGGVEIKVEDHGMGIQKEEQTKLFDRYFQVKNRENFGGLGLGLYISKQIVSSHEGELTVHSESGKGSVFTIYLNENPLLN